MKVIIDGKEIELELTEEQKATVEEALRPKTGWERATLSDTYFPVDGRGFICALSEENKTYDNQAYDIANYFSSEELATNIARAQKLQRKLWRRSAELCDKVNWNNDNNKFSIYYDYLACELKICCHATLKDFGQVYFDTEEHARRVLEEFRDELVWYFTEFRERMD